MTYLQDYTDLPTGSIINDATDEFGYAGNWQPYKMWTGKTVEPAYKSRRRISTLDVKLVPRPEGLIRGHVGGWLTFTVGAKRYLDTLGLSDKWPEGDTDPSPIWYLKTTRSETVFATYPTHGNSWQSWIQEPGRKLAQVKLGYCHLNGAISWPAMKTNSKVGDTSLVDWISFFKIFDLKPIRGNDPSQDLL